MFISENEKLFEMVHELIVNDIYHHGMVNWEGTLKNYGSGSNFIKKSCLRSFNFPRMTGKSTFALKLLEKYDNSTMIVNSYRSTRSINIDGNFSYQFKNLQKDDLITEINSCDFSKIYFKEIVIIDDYSLINKDTLDKLFENIDVTKVKAFICIG
jgi:hypothetical protein